MKRLPGPCRHLKGNYCSVRAKVVTVRDGVARECAKCPGGGTQETLDKGGPS